MDRTFCTNRHLLMVRMLSTYRACISLLHEGTMRYGSFNLYGGVRRHTERASHYYIRAQCVMVRSIRTVRRHTEHASHYYIRAQCITVRSIRMVHRHMERASHYYIRAQCDMVHSTCTVRTARKAHSNCNNPRFINHKPTQAQKPRKVHSKCHIPRARNHKPTQVQSHTFLVL